MAEIARKYVREGADEKTVEARLDLVNTASNIVHVNTKLAMEAAKCYMELAANARKSKLNLPSLFEAIVLATGKSLKSKIVTGDAHFKSLPEVIWVG